MFHHIRGTLEHVTPSCAVLEAGGVGYQLTISLSTHQQLPTAGQACQLFTHFAVSENSQTLYGFATDEERGLFRALITVSGVGPATAMQILSGTTPAEFARAVECQDHTALKKLKGIGEKTAKRIVVELKGARILAITGGPATRPAAATSAKSAAQQALETLGLTPREASARVDKVLAKNPELALEDIIRQALQ